MRSRRAKRSGRVLLSVLCITAAIGGTACEKKGPAERAGEQVDKAVDKAGDAVKDAGDKVKDAGDKVKDAAED